MVTQREVTERSPLVIAHRGASADAPENTLRAFALAADQQADWVELDVHRTADGTLAVHHDATVGDRPITTLRRTELPADVPSLAEALALCAQRGLGVNVEIKSDPRTDDFDPSYAVVPAVLEVLRSAEVPPIERLLVTSFDRDCVARVRALDAAVATGQLAFDIADVPALLERTAAAGHVSVNPWDPFVDEAFVARAHGLGLAVYPWTVDDPDRWRALVALGVDGIITNRPGALRVALADASDTAP